MCSDFDLNIPESGNLDEDFVQKLKAEIFEDKFNQTIDIDCAKFAEKLNNNLRQINALHLMKVEHLKFTQGELEDFASFDFNENLGVVFTLNKKTQKIKAIKVKLSQNNNFQGNISYALTILDCFRNNSFVYAVDSSNLKYRIDEYLQKLRNSYSKNQKPQIGYFDFDGKKYGVTVSGINITLLAQFAS